MLTVNHYLFIKFMAKKVFVSGCYDLLHSGHVEFFQQASRYGDLYVGIGSDATYLEYKHRKPMFPQEERLFMVKNIKAVKDAYINEGSGVSEDMAGEVAEDGPGDARPIGILLREQSGASRWYHLGCSGFHRYLCARSGASLL